MSRLFDPIFGTTEAVAATEDRAWLEALCEAETALARACARAGVIDLPTALQVGAACAELAGGGADELDVLGQRAAAGGNPVIPLVELLRDRVRRRAGDDAAAAVHLGATSQDVLDTAMMLLARRALGVVIADLDGCAGAAASLAREHRDTAMAGRTLLQQAVPTTFGALAAVWGAGLDRAVAGLSSVRSQLPVQLGGAAGTLSALHPHGLEVLAAFADELGLAEPAGVWHTERGVVHQLAAALGTAAAAVAKVAGDVLLLAQTELGELAEASPGGSSSMPHKHNPIAAVTARAAALQAPGLVATLLGAGGQELQRGAGPWHAEWPALISLLRAAGGAAARLRVCLTGLRVDASSMSRNLNGLDTDNGLATNTGHAGDLVDRVPDQEADVILAWREDGRREAPPLVLLNSIGTTTDCWTPCIAPLAEQFRVVRIDTRGHGSSPAAVTNLPVSLDDLAADVLETLDELEIWQADLAGVSLGAMITMWLGAHRPERLRRVALVCTAAHLPTAPDYLDRAAAVRAEGMAAAVGSVRRWITPALAERDAELVDRLRAMFLGVDAESYAQCCEALATMDLRPDLARIAAPTLVLAGAQDTATPPDLLREIAAGVAGARLQLLDPAAHLATVEQPGVIARALLEHFAAGATLDAGYATRRAVLGHDHVERAAAATSEFTEPFQQFLTRYAWGDVWSRPGLGRRDRSIVTLAALVTLGAEHELGMHVRAARRNGLSADEIAEVLLHTALYAGLPRANRAFAIAQQVLDEG